MNVILAGLCGIDIAVGVFAVPPICFQGLNVYLESELLNTLIPYSVAYLYPLGMASKSASVWLLSVITFERYMAVCHPLKAMSLFYSNQQAFCTLLVVMASSLGYNLIRFWEFGLTTDEDNNVRLRLLLRDKPIYHSFYYTGLYLVTHFLVPFVILTILNCLIAGAISSAKTRRQSISRQEMREYKTAHMMIVIIVIFLLTNTIPYVLNICEVLKPDLMESSDNNAIPYVIMDISNLLVVLNSATTCFIYFFFSSKFRRVFLEYLAKWRSLGAETGGKLSKIDLSRPRSFSVNSQYSLQSFNERSTYSTVHTAAKTTSNMTEISQLIRV